MQNKATIADELRRGNAQFASRLAQRLIVPFNNNLVPRPWGGSRLRAYKGLDSASEESDGRSGPIGEAFEISAFDADEEARRHPSVVGLEDGSTIELPDLLEANAETILGRDFVERYGACIPVLPKTLDVKELLSVQGHPPGNTEVYVVIESDPGATIRLGFAADVDAALLRDELNAGRREQAELLELLGGTSVDVDELQRIVAPWLAARGAPADDLAPTLVRRLESESDWLAARALLESMKRLYWHVLDGLNSIHLSAGQVIYNATPERLSAAGIEPSAEVHALGNPDRREALILEIRRPGPTFRAWDNIRFPVRDIDIDAALGALNLRGTSPEEFVVLPELVPGRPGVYCSVDAPSFRVEHLRPGEAPAEGIAVPAEGPHCLHVISGAAELRSPSGEALGRLRRGESALVPVGVGNYVATTSDAGAEIVKVGLPL